MDGLIATLHSPGSDRCGIALIERKKGLVYLQIESLPANILARQMRAMSYHDDLLYITTPGGILVYAVCPEEGNGEFFQRTGRIQLPEWLLGRHLQSDLLGMVISSRRRRILVANNLFNAVDELDLDGRLLARHFLFDIAPEHFPVPDSLGAQFNYGHIRNLAEGGNGDIWITVHRPNEPDLGCVIDFDSGKKVLGNLSFPHGGLFHGNRFFIQEVQAGRLSCYQVEENGRVCGSPLWRSTVRGGQEDEENQLNLRGMACCGNSIYCGACLIGSRMAEQARPRIVSFDLASGVQDERPILLPDLGEFRAGRVFALSSLPAQFREIFPDKMTMFRDGSVMEIRQYVEPAEPVVSDTGDTQETSSKQQLKSTDQLTTDPDKGQEAVPEEGKEAGLVDTATRVAAVSLQNVSLYYTRNAMALFTFNRQKRNRRDFQALADVSFIIYEGETVGIIGRNGSGKSTISMVISGALQPDEGEVRTRGRAQLLSIGLGFRNELTGRENVFINGALLGLNKREIQHRLPEIERFAELGQFMDEPVRTYSSGMRSRLGFAVATAVSPDILILDEVMSTGDAAFRKKAQERMEKMRARTKTIIIISHSISQVREMCSRVIWLHQGRVLMDGEPADVLSEYNAFCKDPEAWIKANDGMFNLALDSGR